MSLSLEIRPRRVLGYIRVLTDGHPVRERSRCRCIPFSNSAATAVVFLSRKSGGETDVDWHWAGGLTLRPFF